VTQGTPKANYVFITHAKPYDDGQLRVVIEVGRLARVNYRWGPFYQSELMLWIEAEPIVERAERVCERLNRSILAVAAAELKRAGLKRLFKHCWEEDEHDYENGD
jgi:hypothetical protein